MALPVSTNASLAQINIIGQAFLWMFVGLIVTGVTSMVIASNQSLVNLVTSNGLILIDLFVAQIAIVAFLGFKINSLPFGAALLAFLGYSFLNGITLSLIFMAYTGSSISVAFFVSAAIFGIMAVYGYTTKKDLTTIGNIAFMGLLGIVVASLVNFFLKSDTMSYIISYVAVLVFVILTARDTQKLKSLSNSVDASSNYGIYGALMLYLDFINIFLAILRITGRRR